MKSETRSQKSESQPDTRVDELRAKLRSLGYLDAGVDRFVLAPAVRSTRPATIALLASFRSGVVAGVLLGPAAAVGLGARLPGLVTDLRDAAVIAVYLAVLFGAAVAMLSFAAALAVSGAVRWTHPSSAERGRTLSTSAGVLVSIACLAYLTLWWRTANAGFGWEAPVWTAFALAVAVAISLLLGHVVTLTARAILVARTVSQAETPRVPGTSWKLATAAALAAFAGAASLLVATAETPRPDAPVALTVGSSGARLTVLAVDGFDPHLYEQLRRAPGVTQPSPLFGVFEYARAALAVADSRDPARLWTTVATGRRPEAHGVERLETRRVAGVRGRLASDAIGRLLGGATDVLRLTRPAIASNVERRVKTFWEVAAQAGLRTGVVNWWATWPADPSAGIVISDRGILRLEHGGALDAELAPPELYDRLKSGWPTVHAEARRSTASFFSITGPGGLPPIAPDITAVLTRSGELDASIVSLAATIAANLDLLVVYLPGLDIAQHTLLGDAVPAPSAVDERLAALRRYYVYIDSLVGAAIRNALRDGRALFVITQPGRLHQSIGILAAAGPGFTAARATGTVLDMAPTVLHTLGVPVAKDFDGRVIEELFEGDHRAKYPVRFVDTYGLKGTASRPRDAQPLDEEMIERLRSLGYLR